MQTLRRIDPFSAGKIAALCNLFVGIIIGLIYGFFIIIVGAFSGGGQGPMLIGMGVAMMIGMPLLYAVLGLLSGLIGGAIYNFVASRFGGLEVELK